jgi:rRNA processing protein Gar1
VPRDVVFNKFATVGGVKESWTAPVYILSAEFADALPADEDQMPPDGNPHPFPGELQQHNNNMFVNPQFPEIGWDAVENLGQGMQGEQGGGMGQQGGWHQENLLNQVEEQVLVGQEDQGVLQEMQESMVLNLSDSSSSSVNMLEVQPQQQYNNMQALYNELNIGMVQTVFGPVLPPEMLCARALQLVLPYFCSRSVPEALKRAPFGFLTKLFGASMSVVELQKEGSMMACFKQLESSSGHSGENEGVIEVMGEQTPVKSKDEVVKSRGRKKYATPLVQSSERRFTRSCLNLDGYKPAPILSVQPKIKKKSRARNLLVTEEEKDQSPRQDEPTARYDEESQAQAPAIPIAVLQRVGQALGIAADKLSKEQLEAAPGKEKKKKQSDA